MPMKKAKPSSRELTAQDFVNVSDITDNLIYTKDGYVFGYIKVRACNDKLLAPSERNAFFDNVTIALESETNPFQLLSLPKTLDVSVMLENLIAVKNKAHTDAKLALVNAEIEYVKQMVVEDTKEPTILLKLWDRLPKSNDSSVFVKRISKLKTALQDARVEAQILTNSELANICKIYAELNVSHDAGEDDDIEKPSIKRGKKEVPVNHDLLNMISPVGGIEFKVARTIIGSTSGKLYSAIKYPSGLDYGWLTNIMNCTEAITCITFTPGNQNEIAEGLSASIKRQLGDAELARDPRQRKRLLKNVNDGDKVISQIDEKNQTIGFFSLVTMPFTEDEDKLEEVCRRVESLYRNHKIKLRCLGNLQKEGFKHISPYHPCQPIIGTIANRIFPLFSMAGGSPMLINSFKDDKGFYFARTNDGNTVILDLMHRSDDRTNSNILIVGGSGAGKSTTVKSIIQILLMQDVKILIIDPEGEYKDLCKEFNGTWINAGGGTSKINMLQIRAIAEDDEDETNPMYRDKSSPLALHMKTLEIFLNLYLPSLSDLQLALLKEAIIELYNSKNIFWDTDISKLKSEDYPIFEDLYQYTKEKGKTDRRLSEISDLLADIGHGSDSFIWNGHTNIDTDNQLIVFDTQRLNSASARIKKAQYFNLTSLCWDLTTLDLDEQVALIADEAHVMVDPEVPQTMQSLRNMSKRVRKYDSLLVVITQQVIDFLDDRVKLYGQALVDLPTYKFIFKVDAQNLKDTVDTFALSEPEKDIIQSAQKRHCVGILGAQRLHLVFELPQSRLDMMGKGGGR